MDIWRLDFSVHNESGRWLDHLIANFQIESVSPDCTNWEGPEAGRFPHFIIAGMSAGHIQESGRNVVAPRQILTHTQHFMVLRGDPEPRFRQWWMNFRFAAAPPPAGFGSAGAAQQPVAVANPEQENIFWQSIMDSSDPADFEAYLEQFPNGVFRSLAQNRLRASEKKVRADPARTVAENVAAGAAAESLQLPVPICDGGEENLECWKELPEPEGCYIWNGGSHVQGGFHPTFEVDWTGGCEGGLASGSGVLTWESRWDGNDQLKIKGQGLLRNGKMEGHWVERHDPRGPLYPTTEEGPHVDGKRHGHWVERVDNGNVSEGLYVEGKRHGREVRRFRDGTMNVGIWNHGKWVRWE